MLLDEFERFFFAFRLAIDFRNPECDGRSNLCREHFRVVLDDYSCSHQGLENFLVHLQKPIHLMPCRDFGETLAAKLFLHQENTHFLYDWVAHCKADSFHHFVDESVDILGNCADFFRGTERFLVARFGDVDDL